MNVPSFLSTNLLQSRYVNRYFVVIFCIGLFFRASFPSTYPLSFDQLLILEHGERILNHDLIVLGPKTGPAFMFIGPLTYYLGALSLLISQGSAYALVVYSIIVYVFTAILLFSVLKLFPIQGKSSTKLNLIMFAVYVISPFFIQIDRTAWNPSPLFASAACVFFPTLHSLLTKKFTIKTAFFLAMGTWLGSQSHFSILLLPPILFTLGILFRSKTVLLCFISSCVGLLVGIIPTIFYDSRHNWEIYRGLMSFLTDKNDSGGTFLDRFIHTFLISLENMEKLMFYSISTAQMYVVGLCILVASVYQAGTQKENRKLLTVCFLWIGLVAFLYAFYRGLTTPEYYFIVQFPAIVVILAMLLSRLSKSLLSFLAVSWIIFILTWFTQDFVTSRAFTLGTQIRTAQTIKTFYSPQSTQLIFDMEPIQRIGFEYLLSLKETPSVQSNHKVHISYPMNNNMLITKQIGDVAIWDDSRTDPRRNYLILGSNILQTPSELKLLSYEYPDTIFPQIRSFILEKDHQTIGRLWLYPPHSQSKDQELSRLISFIQAQGALNQEVGNWRTFVYTDQKTYWVSPYINEYFLIVEMYDDEQVPFPEELLREITIVKS